MPETARILQFPDRKPRLPRPAADALALAKAYLERSRADRNAADAHDPDIVLAICSLLREDKDSFPANVAEEAMVLYEQILKSPNSVGVFDERDYFLGETAFISGTALRHLGRHEDAELWLGRAEAAFRETLNPAPCLANVSYARLTVRYAMGRYQEVLEFIPSLIRSFDRFGMQDESAKACLLQAMTFKLVGRAEDSFRALEALKESARGTRSIYGQVLIELGEHHASENRCDRAMMFYQEALQVLQETGNRMGLAHLRAVVGESLRLQGKLEPALEAYRAAQASFGELGMGKYIVYLHVLIAEVLLALRRDREAEWEILAALPTIEEQKMVPEGFAAVALLKESVRRRKTDPNALRELREHLQASK